MKKTFRLLLIWFYIALALFVSVTVRSVVHSGGWALLVYFASLTVIVIVSVRIAEELFEGISVPLKKLKEAIKAVSRDDLNCILDYDRQGEAGEVCEEFEKLRMKLKTDKEGREQFDRDSKELISNISHDLKTPLTAIRGYVEGIMDGVASSGEMFDRYMKNIYNKTDEMTRLIDELTFYSKIDTNRIPYDFKKLRIMDYFDDCAAETGLELEGKQILFEYTNGLKEDTLVIADPEQLRKVINNIIGNSVKYMNKVPGKVSMNVSDGGDVIRCDISDNGKGVAKEDLDRIFERFYRTDASRNSAQGGSGIGLSIVKKIIEDHGGRIWATCEEGQGLSVHFILRKYEEVETVDEKDTDHRGRSQHRRTGKGLSGDQRV